MKIQEQTIQRHSFKELIALMGDKPLNHGLFAIERTFCGEPIFLYPFKSDHFSIVLFLEGKASGSFNLIDYSIEANQLFFATPETIRQFKTMQPGSRFISLGFTREFAKQSGFDLKHFDLLEILSIKNDPVVSLAPDEVGTLVELLNILKRKTANREPSPVEQQVINHCFITFIYELGAIRQKTKAPQIVKVTRKENITAQFLKLLGERFREERSVNFYAGEMNITAKYLIKVIKETTGRTAGEFIDDMIILEAKALLHNLSCSIAQVAESLHFSNQFFFSTFFKKHTGISPSSYRKTV